MRRISLSALSLMCCACMTAFAQAPLPTQRVRGEIVALDGLNLQVKSRTGEALAIKLTENYAVTSVVKLVPGAHLIVTATRQRDGTLTASRVAVGKNGLVPPM